MRSELPILLVTCMNLHLAVADAACSFMLLYKLYELFLGSLLNSFCNHQCDNMSENKSFRDEAHQEDGRSSWPGRAFGSAYGHYDCKTSSKEGLLRWTRRMDCRSRI